MAQSVVRQLRGTKLQVRKYLLADMKYRDNDEVLVARFWNDELVNMGLTPTQMTAFKLLAIYAQGKLTPADYITRARRQLQEKEPETRGLTYDTRQGMEKDTRKHINE